MANAKSRFKVMSLTDAAADRVRSIMENADHPVAALKVGVRNGGCAGMSYTMEWADQIGPMDEVVETAGVKLLIDPKASLFLIGTQMDYVEEKLKSGFVFNNPNEKGRCGCGESFHV